MIENKSWSLKKKLIALLIPIIIISGLIVVYVVTLPFQQYNHAKSLMNSKSYELAIAAFTHLADYKDSNELLTESRYLFAKQLLEKKEYLKAEEIFVELDLYRDSKKLIIEAKYNYGKSLINDKDYARAIDYLSEIKEYEDSSELLAEARYKEGVVQFEKEAFANAKMYFQSIGKEYKDSQTFLNKIERVFKEHKNTQAITGPFEGTWEDKNGFHQVIFSGNSVTDVFFPNSHETKVYSSNWTLKEEKVTNEIGDVYYIRNNKLYVKDYYGDDVSVYSKVSNSTYIPNEKPSPRIGMTADEVRSSNWGSPSDINKTTTEYGVSEQWVYSNYKYIYFEDGIVTSISE